MNENKILITGTVLNSEDKSVEIYKELVEICNKCNCEVNSPLETMRFVGTDRERYIRAMKLLKDTKLVIAEMSIASTGQGMELQKAVDLNIPIVIVAKENSKISKMILGSNKIIKCVFYKCAEDLREEVECVIKGILK